MKSDAVRIAVIAIVAVLALKFVAPHIAGVPVVATRVGAVPELEAKHGPMVVDVPVCASPVELAAAVRKATSKGKRAMVERVKKIVGKNYTTEVLGKRWCDYLVEIAAAGHAECSRRHRIN